MKHSEDYLLHLLIVLCSDWPMHLLDSVCWSEHLKVLYSTPLKIKKFALRILQISLTFLSKKYVSQKYVIALLFDITILILNYLLMLLFVKTLQHRDYTRWKLTIFYSHSKPKNQSSWQAPLQWYKNDTGMTEVTEQPICKYNTKGKMWSWSDFFCWF